MFQVPEFRVFCFFWYIPSTCIPCVSLLLICFKYLHTLCFASFDVFQVPIYPVFRWCCSVSSTCARNISFFSLYFKYLHACQCPTILSITTGRAGWAWMVLYGAGRPSLTSIFYTLYFASIAVFNIPASHTFSVFDVFHFTVFFCCCVSCLHLCTKHLFASILHTLLFAIWDSRAFTLFLHLSSPILTFITALLKIWWCKMICRVKQHTHHGHDMQSCTLWSTGVLCEWRSSAKLKKCMTGYSFKLLKCLVHNSFNCRWIICSVNQD